MGHAAAPACPGQAPAAVFAGSPRMSRGFPQNAVLMFRGSGVRQRRSPEVRHMNAHIELGRRGEDAAAAYLAGLGWTVLDRNWRCPEGELDIVAHDGRAHV